MPFYRGKKFLRNSMHRAPKYIYQKDRRKILNKKEYTFVKLKTIEGDSYKGIPMFHDKEDRSPTYILDNGIIGIADGKVKSGEMLKVTIMEENCNICEGYVKSEYLSEMNKVGEKEAKNYNKIYTVVSENGANIRKTANIDENNIILNIPKNTYVLANENKRTFNNENQWISIIYIDKENKVAEGYIEKNELKEEISNEIEAMHIRTMRGVASLKQMPTIYSSAIKELENGTEIFVLLTSKEIVADNITWKPAIYLDKTTNRYVSGWVDSGNLIK